METVNGAISIFILLKPALIGTAAGLAGAFGLARFLETLPFQIKPADALTFTAAPAVLLGVAGDESGSDGGAAV